MTLIIRPASRVKHVIERMNSRPDGNLQSSDYLSLGDGCKVEWKCAGKTEIFFLWCTGITVLDTFIKSILVKLVDKTKLKRLHLQKPEYSVYFWSSGIRCYFYSFINVFFTNVYLYKILNTLCR